MSDTSDPVYRCRTSPYRTVPYRAVPYRVQCEAKFDCDIASRAGLPSGWRFYSGEVPHDGYPALLSN